MNNYLPKPKAPCKECERKGCGAYHSECERYQQYLNAQNDYNKANHDRYKLYSALYAMKCIGGKDKGGQR